MVSSMAPVDRLGDLNRLRVDYHVSRSSSPKMLESGLTSLWMCVFVVKVNSHTYNNADMPNNKRKTAKTIKGKDSVHPSSRKAGQLDRVQLRAVKLQRAATKRKGDLKSKCG